jgi:anti-sigma factor RsiW
MRDIPGSHPEDLSPYLDKDYSDKRYEEIRLHISGCAACREEVFNWEAWNGAFRSSGLELEVPPSQWPAILARLEKRRSREGFLEAFLSWVTPPRIAWKAAAALVVVAGVVLSGLEYRNRAEERRQLSALSAYSKTEKIWLIQANNPFRVQESSVENPFVKLERSDGNNPRK